ncbi:MAG: hypothetical protein IGS03_11945 [Candidatus Sericytochromatia bacterium]|nr:hypothetical protein [Candidatus Sericytochromatia bacterium]
MLCSCTATQTPQPAAPAARTPGLSAPPLYLTAREAYDQALPLIEAWEPQARLVHVAVRWPSPGGRSPDWLLYFASDQQGLRVVKNGQRLQVQTPPSASLNPLPECWLDSDEIIRRLQDLSQSTQAVYSMALHSEGHWELIQTEQHWQLAACSGLLASKPEPDLL